MLAVLQWIYGPNAESDPYYQVMHDLVALLPWWYPLMWAVIIGSVVAWRLGRRWRLRRQNRRGLHRVRARVRQLAEAPEGDPWVPAAANDDRPPSSAPSYRQDAGPGRSCPPPPDLPGRRCLPCPAF